MKKLYTLLAFLFPLFSSAQLSVDWQRCYGGSGSEYPHSIQTSDGGYIMLGNSSSTDGMVTNNHGFTDIWVVKMDHYGIPEWRRCYGGSNEDSGRRIFEDPSGGYIVLGQTRSNDGDVSGNHSDLFGNSLDIWVFKINDFGNLIWQRCLGGSSLDQSPVLISADESGYLVSCMTESNDGDVIGFHPELDGDSANQSPDVWLVKLSYSGDILWQRCYGGSDWDLAEVTEDVNGGYLLFGYTESNDGDVVGYHEGLDSILQFDGWDYYRRSDGWVVKLDLVGNIIWQKCLGGSGRDFVDSVMQVADGSYLFQCSTASSDGNVVGYHPGADTTYFQDGTYSIWETSDPWFVKLDAYGEIVWQKCLGGTGNDYLGLTAVSGGYFAIGSTNSSDGDVEGFHPSSFLDARDIWIVRFDYNAEIQWQRCLGGSQDERVWQMLLEDGEYLISARTSSVDGDVVGYHPGMTLEGERTNDNWVFKLDDSGNLLWQKCLGGTDEEGQFDGWYFIRPQLLNTETGYRLISNTHSNNGDVVGYHDSENSTSTGDIWIADLDAAGNLVSQLCLGGSGDDVLQQEILITDDGYLLIARTDSDDGDVSGFYGGRDIWLVKLSNALSVEESSAVGFSVFPNPANDKLQVSLNDNLTNTSYTIYDAQGRAVLNGVLESSRSEISVADLPPAFYTLQLAGRPGALRFVKE
jgi:hypothetical protein